MAEPNHKTAEVSTDELRVILEDYSAVVFDSRPHMEFSVCHIPGALNVAPKPGVPMSQYVSDVNEIGRLVEDKATPIVLYCNGPYCGKSKRLGEDLLGAGYLNVRRYQLGAPTWRALGGIMQIELDGVRYVLEGDHTAVFVDSRTAEDFQTMTLTGSRNIPLAEVAAAKDDGRLPMDDHNTRIVVFGGDTDQARAERPGTWIQFRDQARGAITALVTFLAAWSGESALSASSRTWSEPPRRETSASPPGSGSPTYPAR